jgi:hypothetical protein
MAASRARAALLLLGLLSGPIARAQTPQEKKRSEILNELGLKKKPPAPPAEAAPPAPEVPPPEGSEKPAAPGGKSKGGGKTAGPAGPPAPSFTRAIHPQLVAICKACHSPVGPAAATHLLFTGDPAADHHALVRFVDVHNPEASVVLAKVGGAAIHAGGAPWPPASAPYQRLLAWIRGGARSDAGAAAAPAATPAAPAAAPAASPARRPPPAGATKPPGGESLGAPPAEVPAPAPAPPSPAEAAPPAPSSAPTTTTAGPAGPSFATAVHPVLMATCAVCHRPGGPAAMTRLLLSGEAAHDEAAVRALVDPAAPDRSLLVTKASGQMHGGGAVLPPGDPRLATIVDWIQGLAAPPAPPGTAAGAPAAAGAAPPPVVGVAPSPPPPPPGPPGFGAPLPLPAGFMLDGRFSLDYERRQFTGSPFADGSVNALRSYHHFLFLSRDLAGDPCGLSVEVLTLQFWEAHCRVGRLPPPLHLTLAGGKIVVPFGADPLYHQNYGGLGGFDQPVLPVIWAVEGAAAHLVYEHHGLVLTDDLFVVRGYTLAHADSIINLQSGFSTEDATRLGFGNRVGLAWMFASAWYSAYYNPLPFGRRLFMQAFDLTIWRPRGVPVLGHFSLGLGALRADVSGGGPGVGGVGYDYYDFADYLQVRYYPFDWLYIQYRSGLRTFNHRRGVVIDNTRLTNADASTHNFAIVARYRGLTAGLYYFINLEKVDELANDLIRLSVIYEF